MKPPPTDTTSHSQTTGSGGEAMNAKSTARSRRLPGAVAVPGSRSGVGQDTVPAHGGVASC